MFYTILCFRELIRIMSKIKKAFFANAWLTDTIFSTWASKSTDSLKLTANYVRKTIFCRIWE